ncbi:LytTR family DNA-binding domain-containing protein [Ancylomarina sp. 16SWW S1-10-2]|uniref:LytR/AlgR family response regulator transcription factor n=1 Tax=Ancylomarina sp. 16SWW S1-10-2 TaxID=2499681 RepID=UPI0012ADB8BB|nr:LytTR family DNA-binding domain-containing protein [Ancylomarina sp. 16SWW S1-10-2]MRT94255.1 response regulator transcription factor [Ancylomarina sp. 16SWW S1-10-2]
MNIKCIIVDDEIHARKVLEKYIKDIPHLELIKSCKNALEAMDVLRNQQIDAMFLDINMPKISGLNFLESLQHPPAVVITTAYREYALDAYDLDVIDYLHKPIPFPRFVKAISKIEEKLQAHSTPSVSSTVQPMESIPEFIFIKADKKTIKLNFKDIKYIEGLGDYIKIHTKTKSIVSKITVKRMEELLPENKFPRVHKSFIVALDMIDSIEGNQIEIGDCKIPIGQMYRNAFMEIIQSFTKK